jgi:hypothetical protein
LLNKKIRKRYTKYKGYGLFAKGTIKKGESIWNMDESNKIFPLTPDVKKKYPRVFQWGHHYVLGDHDSDYMNHSCDPTCWWKSDFELVARRDIKLGEEITYDYSSSDIEPEWVASWICYCGSPNCRNRISNKDCLRKDFQKIHGEHLPSWTKKYIKKNNQLNKRVKSNLSH